MDELEKLVFGTFNNIVQDMVQQLEEADKNKEGVDLKVFIKSLSDKYQKLNDFFREARVRMKKKKGWGA